MIEPPVIVSDKKQVFMGVSYYLCGHYLQRDGVRLHRVVYESFNGEIPKGMHVHHIDGNKMNNHPSNLELMERGAHTSHHNKGQHRPIPKPVLDAAARWHGSSDGIEWHKSQYEKTKHLLHVDIKVKCQQCGSEYVARNTGTNMFCSGYCATKHRRQSGVDDEVRVCAYCSETFNVNRYRANKFCSRSCSSKNNAKKAR